MLDFNVIPLWEKKINIKKNKNLFKAHYAFCLYRAKVEAALCNLKHSIGIGIITRLALVLVVCVTYREGRGKMSLLEIEPDNCGV